MTLLADALDDDVASQALADLRSARRKNRIQQLDPFDAFYKAYITALFGAIGIYVAAGWFGDKALTVSQLHRAAHDGPSWLGLIAALAVAVGLRSGGRGGPLAFERAEVRHVLLAPVDRRFSIRRPAIRQVRHTVFLGVSIGAAAGVVAARRMPQNVFEWVGAGAVFGLALGVVAFGAAMVAGGYRLRVWMTDVLALLVIGWSVVDVAADINSSPLTFLSRTFVWPISFSPLAAIGLVVALAIAGWGIAVVNRLSIEAAERRSRLVGQLRFAATLQDVRTVMVLQRQLAQEQIRQRPWIRLPKGKWVGFNQSNGANRGRVYRRVFLRRSLHGMLRWPLLRIVRLFVFAGIAGVSVLGVWSGTAVLALVGGIALWMAALDLCEPLAQEVDRPDRLRSMSQLPGPVYLQLLLVPIFVMFVLVALAAIPSIIYGNDKIVAALWPMGVLMAFAAVGGASLAVNAKPPGEAGMVDTPETASVKFIWRVLVPPGIAVLAFVPLIIARKSWVLHHDIDMMVKANNTVTTFVIAFVVFSFVWVRFSDQFRTAIATAPVKAEEVKKEAAKKEAPVKKQAPSKNKKKKGKR